MRTGATNYVAFALSECRCSHGRARSGIRRVEEKTYPVRSGEATPLVVIPNMFDGLELPDAAVVDVMRTSARRRDVAVFDGGAIARDNPCK